MNVDTVEKALALITAVRDALAKGTKHYNRAGKLLLTEREILETLRTEGAVVFDPRHGAEDAL